MPLDKDGNWFPKRQKNKLPRRNIPRSKGGMYHDPGVTMTSFRIATSKPLIVVFKATCVRRGLPINGVADALLRMYVENPDMLRSSDVRKNGQRPWKWSESYPKAIEGQEEEE